MELEFPNCAHSGCSQVSLLPLKCEFCAKEYCRHHIFVDNHNCDEYRLVTRISPVCPLCNQVVVVRPNENIDCKVNQHIEFGCRVFKPAFSPQMKKDNRCAFHRCKEVCWSPIKCYHCSKKFCPAHHIPEVHNCAVMNGAIARRRALLSSMPCPDRLRNKKSCTVDECCSFEEDKIGLDVTLGEEFSWKSEKSCASMVPSAFTVGRAVDFIAKKEGIINNNNVPGMKKLCLFLGNSSEPMMMQQSLSVFNDGTSHLKLRLGYTTEDLSSCSSSSSSSSSSYACHPLLFCPPPSAAPSLMMTAYFSGLFSKTPLKDQIC